MVTEGEATEHVAEVEQRAEQLDGLAAEGVRQPREDGGQQKRQQLRCRGDLPAGDRLG